ncbi:hypothetical protein OGATHE_006757 [Ogataea polymorpha]|uniref:Uncharacterized protein n=1 Tax=Ogataea polymorpha TaxID=460523 RepID=A0A9P8SZ02_9ASCO|nr:hypothetical protein OGATHE_006757 [Ogataea polymorpha]
MFGHHFLVTQKRTLVFIVAEHTAAALFLDFCDKPGSQLDAAAVGTFQGKIPHGSGKWVFGAQFKVSGELDSERKVTRDVVVGDLNFCPGERSGLVKTHHFDVCCLLERGAAAADQNAVFGGQSGPDKQRRRRSKPKTTRTRNDKNSNRELQGPHCPATHVNV